MIKQTLEELIDLNRGGTKDVIVRKKALIFRKNTEKTSLFSLKLGIPPTGKCYSPHCLGDWKD